tara:strand:- start:802 stop:1224 length:423 start_codon:yes stop_codon:yes gene_type:complete
MQYLPNTVQDIILFPQYFIPDNNLSINQKIYLSFQLNNTSKINQELLKNINKFKECQTCFVTDFINTDYYYLKNKPIYKFLLYTLLKQKKKSTIHLIESNNITNYNFLNYVFNNHIYINNSSNIDIEHSINRALITSIYN